jgi:phosphoribosylformimino-5-aminoimidazole carboxamide ribonucleotide (ProFAR) isomerase
VVGVVIGKALYTGDVDLVEAIAVAAEDDPGAEESSL